MNCPKSCCSIKSDQKWHKHNRITKLKTKQVLFRERNTTRILEWASPSEVNCEKAPQRLLGWHYVWWRHYSALRAHSNYTNYICRERGGGVYKVSRELSFAFILIMLWKTHFLSNSFHSSMPITLKNCYFLIKMSHGGGGWPGGGRKSVTYYLNGPQRYLRVCSNVRDDFGVFWKVSINVTVMVEGCNYNGVSPPKIFKFCFRMYFWNCLCRITETDVWLNMNDF